MDKKTDNQDSVYAPPAPEIQEQISSLMGLPADEALPQDGGYEPITTVTTKDESEEGADVPENLKPDNKQRTIENIKGSNLNTNKEALEPIDVHKQDSETDKAVESIVKAESDVVIASEDEKRDKYNLPTSKPKGIKRFFYGWWHNKWARRITIIIILSSIIAVIAIPELRYSLLNAIGVRSGMELQVVDQRSGRPVKNVTVSIQDIDQLTDDNGRVKYTELYLGESIVKFNKRSFAPKEETIVLGWGSNPIYGAYEITPTGTTYTYTIKDWLTGNPISQAAVSDGESEALTDDKGTAKLIIEPTDEDIVTTISAPGYKSSQVTISADTTESQEVALVLGRKDIYVSNRDGLYSIYSRYIDGTGEDLLLKGTGNEQDNMALLNHPANNLVAITSTRDGNRADSGGVQSELYVLNTDTKELTKVKDSGALRIKILGWYNDSLVYWKDNQTYQSQSKDSHSVYAYDSRNQQSKELVKATYLGSVRLLDNILYYIITPSDEGFQSVGLSKINIDGSGKQTLIAGNVWTFTQMDTLKLHVSAENNVWYTVAHPSGSVETLDGAPPTIKDVTFIPNYNNKLYSYIETRDGKGTLLTIKSTEPIQQSKEIIRESGVRFPIRWLNDDTIIYSVATGQETGNYVINIDKKEAKRIGDATILSSSEAYIY